MAWQPSRRRQPEHHGGGYGGDHPSCCPGQVGDEQRRPARSPARCAARRADPRQPPAASAVAVAPTAGVSTWPAAIARRDTPLVASATSVIHSALATARWASCPPAGAPLTATYAPTAAVPASSARMVLASTSSA